VEIFRGLDWTEKEVAAQWWLVDDGTGEALRRPLRGHISIRRLAGRYCVGYVDLMLGCLHRCPETAALVRGTQCDICRRREGLWPCISCDGAACRQRPLSDAVRDYCSSLHYVYLAYFGHDGNDLVKVGTASDLRGAKRLWEQGALCAAFIAMGPGPAMKQLERAIYNLGYPMQVSRATKQRLLAAGFGIESGHDSVRRAAEQVRRTLGRQWPQLMADPVPVPASALQRQWPQRAIAMAIPLTGDVAVGGTVVAAMGGFVLLDHSGELSIVDLGSARGAPTRWGDPIGPPHKRQLALF